MLLLKAFKDIFFKSFWTLLVLTIIFVELIEAKKIFNLLKNLSLNEKFSGR